VLHYAASRGHQEIIALLLAHGVDDTILDEV